MHLDPCLLKDGSLRREKLPVILSDECNTTPLKLQGLSVGFLHSYIPAPDLLYASTVESLKAHVFYKQCCLIQILNMIHGKFAVTTNIYFPHRCKSMSRYYSSTVARVIYSTQSGKSSLVNGPKSFPLRLFHLKPKLSLSFPFLFPSDSFFLSYSYFSVGYKVTSSPVLRNINGTPCSFDTSLELFFSPDHVRIQERLCLPNREVTVALAFKPNKPAMCCERACR